MRAVFAGSDAFGVPTLYRLLSGVAGIRLVGVVTAPDRPAGRGRRVSSPPEKQIASEHGVALVQPGRLRNPAELEKVLRLSPDLLIVASFGQILPRRLLDAPPHGALNLHPSLLPRFRGPSPIQGAILEGATVTGTSVMLMSEGMDEGPILSQRRTDIGPEETAGELGGRLAEMSADLLAETLPAWLRGEVQPRPQENAEATYTRLLRKEDGRMDWNRASAMIAREVRAYNPWPTAYTFWGDRLVRLLAARHREGTGTPGRVMGLESGSLAIGTGEGILLVDVLQIEGGRALPAVDLVRGHRTLVEAQLA